MGLYRFGDRVRRKGARQNNTGWSAACAGRGCPVSVECVVTGYTESGHVLLEDMTNDGRGWVEVYFELVEPATRLAPAAGSSTDAAEGLVLNKPVITEALPEPELTEKFDALVAERDALVDQLTQVSDQRDAAVAAAKGFGEDILVMKRNARHERYEAQVGAMAAVRILRALASGMDDLDLYDLANQLGHISRICDEQGNGADAKLCGEAASALGIAARAITDWQAV